MAQTMVKGPGEKERPCGRYIWTVILFGLATAIGGWAENAVAESRVSADFNGDGFDDLALGVPGEDIRGLIDAGAVNVIYGSATGLTAIGNQLWHQDSTDIEDLAEDGDTFGAPSHRETSTGTASVTSRSAFLMRTLPRAARTKPAQER